MRIFKGIFAGTGITLIALSAGVILLMGPLENMLKRRIETRLAYIFQSDVSIGALRVLPLQRGAVISDLAVSNPAGFKRLDAMRFEQVRVTFEMQTLFSSMPVLESVQLEGAHVYLRHEAGQGTNLITLARSARTAADSDAGSKKPGRKIFIRELSSTQGRVHLSTNLLPIGQVPMRLEDFSLDNIGSEEPVSTAEFVAVFTRSLLWEILTLKGLLRPVADTLREELDRLFPPHMPPVR